MKIRLALQMSAFVATSLLLFSGMVTACFFLTAWLYQSLNHAPPPLVVQIINSLLGFLLSALLFIGFFALSNARARARGRQMGVFEPILEALEQISRGDFRVRLKPTPGANLITAELAKSVNQVATELNQMEHLRQEFISNVSHEIQSPLTSMHGFARALRVQRLSAEDRDHYLSIIETESTRLSRMTDNMLRLASLETEQMKIEAKPYRLDKQIRNLILSCEPLWTGKSIAVDAALEEIEIQADEDLIGQVWINLFHNSLKFTPEGGKVYVALYRQDNMVECKFTDTGIGIPVEAQARIFERFYKADWSRERAKGGSGLGLAIVKKIIELHQGTIAVTSQPGLGTTMTVSLPVT